jgi:hypothetical protein
LFSSTIVKIRHDEKYTKLYKVVFEIREHRSAFRLGFGLVIDLRYICGLALNDEKVDDGKGFVEESNWSGNRIVTAIVHRVSGSAFNLFKASAQCCEE